MKPHSTRANGVVLRQLTREYKAELEVMISRNPVVHLFEAEQLTKFNLPAPGFPIPLRPPYGFVGIFQRSLPSQHSETDSGDEDTGGLVPQTLRTMATHFFSSSVARGGAQAKTTEKLVGALWLGGNCVPLEIPEEYLDDAAHFLVRNSKYIASIFGVEDLVMPLWERASYGFSQVIDERPNQPLLYLPPDTPLDLSRPLQREKLVAPPIDGGVRWARTGDRASLLQASVAMFTEEVGYDPLERDAAGYTRRVGDFISGGRTLVATNSEGVVIFKTDVGLAHENHCQLQGVWLHPAYRGYGLSATLLAQACQLIRPKHEHISLYVNDYNVRARALYERLGFEQVSIFSTVLF